MTPSSTEMPSAAAPPAIRGTRPLRIGILTRNFPPLAGGMSEHAAGLAAALADQADVLVFAPPGAEPDPRARYSLRPVLSRDVHRNGSLLTERSVDVWLGLSANFAPLAERSSKPFFVYAHGNDFLRPNPEPSSALEARLARMPGLWRGREVLVAPLEGCARRHRRRLIRSGLQASQAIFVNSRFTRDLLGRTYPLGGTPVIVSYPGCAERFFGPLIPARAAGPLELLTVCRADRSNRRKNVAGVLRALAQLEGDPPWRYTLIGGGDDESHLRELARKLGLGDRVRIRGQCSSAEVVRAYSEADLFILAAQASPVDVEGFGMVYVEANAAGRPVIGSRTGGSVEAIRPGTTGYLLPDSRPETIASGLQRFAAQRERFSTESIRAFAEGFRWPRVAGHMLEALQSHA